MTDTNVAEKFRLEVDQNVRLGAHDVDGHFKVLSREVAKFRDALGNTHKVHSYRIGITWGNEEADSKIGELWDSAKYSALFMPPSNETAKSHPPGRGRFRIQFSGLVLREDGSVESIHAEDGQDETFMATIVGKEGSPKRIQGSTVRWPEGGSASISLFI